MQFVCPCSTKSHALLPPLLQLTPEWERLAALIEADADLKQELGWVREMYGFAAAVALSRIKLELMRGPTSNPFISQLPIDHTLGGAHAFHYTQVRGWVCRVGGRVGDGGLKVLRGIKWGWGWGWGNSLLLLPVAA